MDCGSKVDEITYRRRPRRNTKCFIELKDIRSQVSLSNIHVEDGPIFPWMYAAQKMEEVNRLDDIKTIVNLIDTELNNRYFHMRDELERLRELTL